MSDLPGEGGLAELIRDWEDREQALLAIIEGHKRCLAFAEKLLDEHRREKTGISEIVRPDEFAANN